jgi:hypothetical protein
VSSNRKTTRKTGFGKKKEIFVAKARFSQYNWKEAKKKL